MPNSTSGAGTIFWNGRFITFFSWKKSEVSVVERLVVIGAATPTIIRVIDDINQHGAGQIEFVGFLDNADLGDKFHGIDILGKFEAVRRYEPDGVILINTISGSIASRVE